MSQGANVNDRKNLVHLQISKIHLAANENRPRLFITTPVYDWKHAFQLYKIHHLPTAINSTHAIMYENLPNGLAVANNRQTFVELHEEEMRKCSENGPACLLQRVMIKRTAKQHAPRCYF